MEEKVTELLDIADQCRKAALELENNGFNEKLSAFEDVIRKVERASSNSWLGYQANVYYVDFNIPQPGDHFSQEWGLQDNFINPVSENWREYTPEAVREYIFDKSGVNKNSPLVDVANSTGKLFNTLQDKLVTMLTIVSEDAKSETIEGYRGEAKKLKSNISQRELMRASQPRGEFMSNDSLAISQPFTAPPHIGVKCWLYSLKTYFTQIDELAKTSERAAAYLREKYRKVVPEKLIEGKVFIGHGRSLLWKDLSSFLTDRLKLEWDEFSSESTAGISINERLEAMLDQASFAFLIMSAEDEHLNSTMHARENVIHEIGLFQGRLTFKRAIILLEEGCQEFSNIHGVGQLRFPKGNIQAKFEDIRRVLEREGLIES